MVVLVNDDQDGDGYSSLHDCDDTNDEIYPWADETAGDGIDQNCSGSDALDPTVADGYEDDDTFATANMLPMFSGYPWEIQLRPEVYAAQRTIHEDADEDWFELVVPAFGYVEIEYEEWEGDFDYDIFESDGTTAASGSYYIENESDSAQTYYVQVVQDSPGDRASYAIGYYSYGVDADGDGYYTEDWGEDYDCDDSDPDINYDATDTFVDGVDSDCDGFGRADTCEDISGTWTLNVTNIDSSCGPEEDWDDVVEIEQYGCTLIATGIKDGSETTGYIDGTSVVLGPEAYDDDGGVTTSTFIFTLDSATSGAGSEVWTWVENAPGNETCTNGTADITMTSGVPL